LQDLDLSERAGSIARHSLDCLLTLLVSPSAVRERIRAVPIIFGYRRGFGTVRPARMEFLVGTAGSLEITQQYLDDVNPSGEDMQARIDKAGRL